MTCRVWQMPPPLQASLLVAAHRIMDSRPPDFTAGDNYLQRWRLAPYGDNENIYLHRFVGDDEDAALHDHPYDNVSVVLDGSYYEHFHTLPLMAYDGTYKTDAVRRITGDVIERSADVSHRLSMYEPGVPVITMFTTGPRIRRWGFHCVSGWVDYEQFLKPNGGRIGCP